MSGMDSITAVLDRCDRVCTIDQNVSKSVAHASASPDFFMGGSARLTSAWSISAETTFVCHSPHSGYFSPK